MFLLQQQTYLQQYYFSCPIIIPIILKFKSFILINSYYYYHNLTFGKYNYYNAYMQKKLKCWFKYMLIDRLKMLSVNIPQGSRTISNNTFFLLFRYKLSVPDFSMYAFFYQIFKAMFPVVKDTNNKNANESNFLKHK